MKRITLVVIGLILLLSGCSPLKNIEEENIENSEVLELSETEKTYANLVLQTLKEQHKDKVFLDGVNYKSYDTKNKRSEIVIQIMENTGDGGFLRLSEDNNFIGLSYNSKNNDFESITEQMKVVISILLITNNNTDLELFTDELVPIVEKILQISELEKEESIQETFTLNGNTYSLLFNTGFTTINKK